MKHLYTYLPKDNTADTEGILSTRLAPKGWEKYIERSGKHTKEEVLAWLDSLAPGFKRSNAISVFTEPIPDTAHPDMKAFRDAKALYAIPEYKELVRLGVAKALRRIRTGNRRGTDPTSYPKYRKIDWEHIEPGKFLFSNVPHYLVELDKGKVPAKYIKDKKALSRELMSEVAKLAENYKLPVFAVTDGASITRNNGNPGIKAAREALAKWEKAHGGDPDEDWGVVKRASGINSIEDLKQAYKGISYGLIDRKADKAWKETHKDTTFDDWENHWRLLSPQQLLKHRTGVCYDTAKANDYFLNKLGIKHINLFGYPKGEDPSSEVPTHAFTVYQDPVDRKWHWLEGSWGPHKDNKLVADSAEEAVDQISALLAAANKGKPYTIVPIRSFPRTGVKMRTFVNKIIKTASAEAPYGYRYNPKTKKFDGAPKFTGWRGPIKLHNGKVMTEFSTTVDGREIPMIVPTTTDEDIKQIQANIKNGTPIPQRIFDKAINFARQRVKEGKDPFYNGDKEDRSLVQPYTPAN